MEKIQQTIKSKKFKQIFYAALIITLIGWVIFRFAAVASENARYVFNASRVAADQGAPIETLHSEKQAIAAAISMQNAMVKVNSENCQKGYPEIRIPF